ncbi:MAG: class I SAM-dependent methyltransferase [Candidatus Aminicenantes bacterium]|nr:class I SAM-dependent methyltransferase [Candidatus Aminicenantes bacterium]
MTKKGILFAALLAGIVLAFMAGALAQHIPQPPAEQIWQAQRQFVPVADFPAKGLILDIGGGGWGVIGQLKGQQVITIDIDPRELLEAPPGPLLKIVMDARQLQFLENTFPTATVFFTFMFLAPADHEHVFRELHRVLAPGGRLLIWDAIFPNLEDKNKKFASIPITFKLPGRDIDAGYGTYLVPGGQGLAHFEGLAHKTGFAVVSKTSAQEWFFLELSKPLMAK